MHVRLRGIELWRALYRSFTVFCGRGQTFSVNVRSRPFVTVRDHIPRYVVRAPRHKLQRRPRPSHQSLTPDHRRNPELLSYQHVRHLQIRLDHLMPWPDPLPGRLRDEPELDTKIPFFALLPGRTLLGRSIARTFEMLVAEAPPASGEDEQLLPLIQYLYAVADTEVRHYGAEWDIDDEIVPVPAVAAFALAVDEVSTAARKLLSSLHTHAAPRDRAVEAEKARARARERFA